MLTKKFVILTLVMVVAVFYGGTRLAYANGGETVNVVNFEYQPTSVTVQVGDTVTWNNTEGFHTVDADDGSFGNAPGTGWTFAHTFTAAGTYEYFCEIHSTPDGTSMNGVVIVEAPTAVTVNTLDVTHNGWWKRAIAGTGALALVGMAVVIAQRRRNAE